MRSYELSISEDYVPSWGVKEAVREFFQNGIDEQTRDDNNEMFFDYCPDTQVLKVGNKHSKLDPKTLLFGYTEKNDQDDMIGNHGEGYKIATVVLLRLNKQITFYNYGYRQVWRPRFVNSRKYGVKVPTFFVDTKYIWQSVPDNDLTIEISGITPEEYADIVESNLHLSDKDYDRVTTEYGDLLTADKYKSKIFVGGLFICEDPRIDIGVNFKPQIVRLERDRSMVNSFDVQWYLSRMIEQSRNKELIVSAMSTYSGAYISYSHLSGSLGDDIAKDFLDEYGYDAIPVADQEDAAYSVSPNTVIVSKTMRDMILESRFYKNNLTTNTDFDENSIYRRLQEFANEARDHLYSGERKTLAKLLLDVRDMELKLKKYADTDIDNQSDK